VCQFRLTRTIPQSAAEVPQEFSSPVVCDEMLTLRVPDSLAASRFAG
jgi:hypothetical protein